MRKVSSLNDVSVAVDRLTTQTDYANIVIVKDNIADVITVAGNVVDVNTVASISGEISSLAARKLAIDALYADQAALDSLYADKATLDSLYADKINVDTVATDIVKVNNYYDTYLGEGTTNPSTRRDGSPLLGGETFTNTSYTPARYMYYDINTATWLEASDTYRRSEVDAADSVVTGNSLAFAIALG